MLILARLGDNWISPSSRNVHICDWLCGLGLDKSPSPVHLWGLWGDISEGHLHRKINKDGHTHYIFSPAVSTVYPMSKGYKHCCVDVSILCPHDNWVWVSDVQLVLGFSTISLLENTIFIYITKSPQKIQNKSKPLPLTRQCPQIINFFVVARSLPLVNKGVRIWQSPQK